MRGIDLARRTGWLGLAVALLLGCGPSDGTIGVLGSASPPAAKAPTFEEEFATEDTLWETDAPLPGAAVRVADSVAAAGDGLAAALILPGHPEFSASDGTGPDVATALFSEQRFGFGTYRSRVAFGACGAKEEAAQAMLGYFNDGADHDGNSIIDDVEIDFQVLCGSPSFAYLTVFTDYEESGGDVLFRKLTHVVDFATGATYDTPSASDDELVAGAGEPALRLPDLILPGRFYELGFEWHAGSVRFFIDANDGGGERTLWTLDDPAHVPSAAVAVTYNLWHPDTHWLPAIDTAADFPAGDVVMQVDWFRYYAE